MPPLAESGLLPDVQAPWHTQANEGATPAGGSRTWLFRQGVGIGAIGSFPDLEDKPHAVRCARVAWSREAVDDWLNSKLTEANDAKVA